MSGITLGEAWGWIIAAAAGVVTLTKVVDIVAGKLKPNRDARNKVNELEAKVQKLEETTEQMKRESGAQMRALLALLDHALTGDNEVQMNESRAELVQMLTKR